MSGHLPARLQPRVRAELAGGKSGHAACLELGAYVLAPGRLDPSSRRAMSQAGALLGAGVGGVNPARIPEQGPLSPQGRAAS